MKNRTLIVCIDFYPFDPYASDSLALTNVAMRTGSKGAYYANPCFTNTSHNLFKVALNSCITTTLSNLSGAYL